MELLWWTPSAAELLRTGEGAALLEGFLNVSCSHPWVLSSARFLLLLCHSPRLSQSYFCQFVVIYFCERNGHWDVLAFHLVDVTPQFFLSRVIFCHIQRRAWSYQKLNLVISPPEEKHRRISKENIFPILPYIILKVFRGSCLCNSSKTLSPPGPITMNLYEGPGF